MICMKHYSDCISCLIQAMDFSLRENDTSRQQSQFVVDYGFSAVFIRLFGWIQEEKTLLKEQLQYSYRFN